MKKLILFIFVVILSLFNNSFCYRIVCEKNIVAGTRPYQLTNKNFTYYFIVPENQYLKYGQARICYIELSREDKEEITRTLQNFNKRTPITEIKAEFHPQSIVGKVLTDITYKVKNLSQNAIARVQDVFTHISVFA